MAKIATTYVVDLFSGAGDLNLGTARAGYIVRGAIDTETEALNIHKCNFPHTIHLPTDIATLSGQYSFWIGVKFTT